MAREDKSCGSGLYFLSLVNCAVQREEELLTFALHVCFFII